MDQLGEYLVRRLIGEGGMGKVYEAEERLSKRKVALKVLHPEVAGSEQGRRLFLNEMQILARLEHPNIVRSLASTEVDGQLVMVLEYLDGRTLRSVLSGAGRLPWSDAVSVVISVAHALGAAHGQEPPVIHRDLKPENIMVLSDGSVKVMDFGIAKVVEALNQTNTQSVGTLQYMSPEQIDAHTIDHRSDLYCLGLIFYELVAGKPPFSSSSPRQLLNLQCTAEPPPLPEEVRAGLPKGVEQLVFQLLEKAPEDRPYLATDVVERLEPFQSAVGPALRGTNAPRTTPAPTYRSPRAITPRDASSGQGGGRSAAGSAARSAAAAASAPLASAAAGSAQAEPATTPAPSAEERAGGGALGGGRAQKPLERRADTIALVEQMEKGREVPTRIAIGIIVALSLLAGIAAYVVRSTSEAQAPPAGPTADRSVTPAPPRRGSR